MVYDAVWLALAVAAGHRACRLMAPHRGSERGTVGPVRPRAAGPAPQDRDLVPEDQDLRVLRGITLGQEHQPAEHPDHGQVDETNKHERRA